MKLHWEDGNRSMWWVRGQTAEARRTTILQPVEQKPHSQKDTQDEKAEGYISDEETRKNPRKTTK